MATSTKANEDLAADRFSVARDLRNILAGNEGELRRILFINPNDPRVEELQETVDRQRKEYSEYLGSLTDEQRESLEALALTPGVPYTHVAA